MPTVRVAVAANFVGPARELGALFEQAHPYRVEIVSGSTGALYAQITQGAPFDLFLAADQVRPMALETNGLIVPASRFTYAEGQLVLWRMQGQPATRATPEEILRGEVRALALANPTLAPYGAAARHWLAERGLLDQLADKLVFGQNVAQAAAMVATGNAQYGLVSLAQVLPLAGEGEFWPIPIDQYPALKQDAVLLPRAASNPAALALVAFLRGPVAQTRIAQLGYAAR